MLGKLLKYDLKATFKFLAIFYTLAIVFAIITRILFANNNSLFLTILAYVFNGATIAMIANILINNLIDWEKSFKIIEVSVIDESLLILDLDKAVQVAL